MLRQFIKYELSGVFFYTVAKEGSFIAASQKLGYAQSNLSTRIRQLEDSLGAELFVRSRSGVRLTEKGQVLYGYAEKLLLLSAEAEGAVCEELYDTGRLTISTMESAAVSFIPGMLADYHTSNPEVEVHVRTGTSRDGLHAVLRNEADLAIVAGQNQHEELVSLPLMTEKLVIVTGAGDSENRELEKLLMRPLLVFPDGCTYRQMLEHMLADKGIASVKTMEFTSLGAILASVSAGLGISFFPESAIAAFSACDALHIVEVPEKYQRIGIFMVYRKKSSNNKTLMDFIRKADPGQK